jgi:hypothetical protein
MTPAGSADIKDMFNTKFVDSAYDLPYSIGIPEKVEQSSGHLRGWVDITGFDKMMRDNGTNYVPGDPAEYAIVQNEAWGVFRCSTCGYSIIKNIQKYASGSNTVAVLNMKMTWYELVCSKDGCFCVEHIEYESFQDSEVSTKRFNFPSNQSITLKIYNGSVYKPQILNFNPSHSITSIRITTTNGSIKQYLMAGQVAYTAKNIPYMNLTATDHYEQSGRNISKLNNEIIINSNLSSIEFFTPYGKLNASANITKILMPETNIKGGVFGLIYMVIVFFGGLYVMARSTF